MASLGKVLRDIVPNLRSIYPTSETENTEIAPGLINRGVGIPDGSELLFSLSIDRQLLASNVLAIKQGNHVLVDLQEFFTAMEFPITVDPGNRKASGWFIRQSRRFDLDVDDGTVTVDGRRMRIRPSSLRLTETGIIASTAAISRWFSINLDVDFRLVDIAITSTAALPIQERALRRRKRAGLQQAEGSHAVHPRQPLKRELFTRPIADLQLSNQIRRGPSANINDTKFSMLLKNQTLGGGLSLYNSGEKGDLSSSFRARLDYHDPDDELFAPLPIEQIGLGDIDTVRSTLAKSGFLERGLYITNKPLGQRGDAGSTNLEGDSLPDWDIELYRNNILVEFQTVGTDGRYSFRDVPIFSPDDIFRLVFYGPQGEQREETVTVTTATGAGPLSRLSYEFSASQQDRALSNLLNEEETESKGYRYAGKLHLSPDPESVMTLSAESFEGDEREHRIVEAAYQTRSEGDLGRIQLAKDLNGGQALNLLGQFRLGSNAYRFEHTWLDSFDAAKNASSDPRWDTRLDVSTNLKALREGAPSVGLTLGAQHQYFVGGVNALSIRGGFSGRIDQVSFSNQLLWNLNFPQGTDWTSTVSGSGQAFAAIDDFRLNARALYDLQPYTDLQTLSLGIDYMYETDIRPRFEIRRDQQRGLTAFAASLNLDFGEATVSPRFGLDTDGNISAFLTVRFSAGYDPELDTVYFNQRPMGNSGVVLAHVFVDENEDGAFNEGDVSIKDVSVQAAQAHGGGLTDENGIVLLGTLGSFAETDIEIETESLPLDNVIPVPPGVSVRTYPGIPQAVRLPLIRTTDLNATLMLRDVTGALRPIPSTTATLVHLSTGVTNTATSDEDGAIVFPKVREGSYRLDVDISGTKEAPITAPPSKLIHVANAQIGVTSVNLIAAEDGQIPGGVGDAAAAGVEISGANFVPLDGGDSEQKPDEQEGPDPDEFDDDFVHLVELGHFKTYFGFLASWVQLSRRTDLLSRAYIHARSTQNSYGLYAGLFQERPDADLACREIRQAWPRCKVISIDPESFRSELQPFPPGS